MVTKDPIREMVSGRTVNVWSVQQSLNQLTLKRWSGWLRWLTLCAWP
jgi:hypothetical protein